jgi:peptidyl-dipeptidase Dcp
LEADASKELQEAAKEIIPLMTAYSNYVSLNENLFIRIKEVYDHRLQSNLTKEQSILLEKTYLNFKRSGAELKDEDKNKYENLTQELSALGLTYKENVLKATNSYILHITKKSDLKGIPVQEQAYAAEKAKNKGETGWIFDLSAPSYSAFMKYADNRSLREELYKAYNSRAFHSDNADNSNVVINIVNKRLELAKLLGYQTYADYVLETRMAEHKDSVWNFLHRLTAITKIAAENDLKELTPLQKPTVHCKLGIGAIMPIN